MTEQAKYKSNLKEIVSGNYVFDSDTDQSDVSGFLNYGSLILQPAVVISSAPLGSGRDLRTINRRLSGKSIVQKREATSS